MNSGAKAFAALTSLIPRREGGHNWYHAMYRTNLRILEVFRSRLGGRLESRPTHSEAKPSEVRAPAELARADNPVSAAR